MSAGRIHPEWWTPATPPTDEHASSRGAIEFSEQFQQLFAEFNTERLALAGVLAVIREQEATDQTVCLGELIPDATEVPEGDSWTNHLKHTYFTFRLWPITTAEGYFIAKDGMLVRQGDEELNSVSEFNFNTAAELEEIISAMRLMRESL